MKRTYYNKKNINHKRSVRFPRLDYSRNIIFVDESGVPTLKDKSTFYLQTAIIAKKGEIEKAKDYYINLKKKYFGFSDKIHASELFSKSITINSDRKKKLFRIKRYRNNYIEELAKFIDTIPFIFFTTIVNKKNLLKKAPYTKIGKPYNTTINKGYQLWKEKYKSVAKINNFHQASVGQLITLIQRSKIKNINNYYPLEITLKNILEKYFKYYTSNFGKQCKFEMAFESSPYHHKIIEIMDKFKIEKRNKKLSLLATKLRKNIYCISFPNKDSLYLGLELADIISYGYHLSCYKELSSPDNELFIEIWKKIKKKESRG